MQCWFCMSVACLQCQNYLLFSVELFSAECVWLHISCVCLCVCVCVCVCLCVAVCKVGYYRAHSPEGACSPCPAHSYAPREGSTSCRCDKGFYRSETDPPSSTCTSTHTHSHTQTHALTHTHTHTHTHKHT